MICLAKISFAKLLILISATLLLSLSTMSNAYPMNTLEDSSEDVDDYFGRDRISESRNDENGPSDDFFDSRYPPPPPQAVATKRALSFFANWKPHNSIRGGGSVGQGRDPSTDFVSAVARAGPSRPVGQPLRWG